MQNHLNAVNLNFCCYDFLDKCNIHGMVYDVFWPQNRILNLLFRVFITFASSQNQNYF